MTKIYGLLILVVWTIVLYRRFLYVRKLKEYGQRIDPIIVRSEYEGDRTVCRRADQEREWLIKASNRMGVIVYEVIHGEGEFYGETWEEYEDRVYQFEVEKIREHRKQWQGVNRKHFNAIAMNQQGVEWEVTYEPA